MASNDRGGGPGSYTSRGVRSAMDAPFSGKGLNKSGIGGTRPMKAPFDKPQDVGRNDIPTVIYVNMPTKGAPRTATAGQVSQPSLGTQNVGTRRFKRPR